MFGFDFGSFISVAYYQLICRSHILLSERALHVIAVISVGATVQFMNTNILQSIIATQMICGEIVADRCIARLPLSAPIK